MSTNGVRSVSLADSSRHGLKPNITVAVRMDSTNQNPLDYYLLPSLDLTFEKLILAEDNPVSLDAYRFDTLDFFSAWPSGREFRRQHE